MKARVGDGVRDVSSSAASFFLAVGVGRILGAVTIVNRSSDSIANIADNEQPVLHFGLVL